MTNERGRAAPEVGTLAQEAVALFGALSGWVGEHGGDLGAAFSGDAFSEGSAFAGDGFAGDGFAEDVGEAETASEGREGTGCQCNGHQSAGAHGAGHQGAGARGTGERAQHAEQVRAAHTPSCTWCPVCRIMDTARQMTPEVRQHLIDAGTSLFAAVSALMATEPPSEEEQARERAERMGHDWMGGAPPTPEGPDFRA